MYDMPPTKHTCPLELPPSRVRLTTPQRPCRPNRPRQSSVLCRMLRRLSPSARRFLNASPVPAPREATVFCLKTIRDLSRSAATCTRGWCCSGSRRSTGPGAGSLCTVSQRLPYGSGRLVAVASAKEAAPETYDASCNETFAVYSVLRA